MKYTKLEYVPPRLLTKKIFFKLTSMWQLLGITVVSIYYTIKLSSRFSYVTLSYVLAFFFAFLYFFPTFKTFYARDSFKKEVKQEGGFLMLLQMTIVAGCITWIATFAVVTGWMYFENRLV